MLLCLTKYCKQWPTPSSALLGSLKEGKILPGLRHYTKDKWKAISVWTTPGGRCNVGETVGAALRREVGEEVGITDLQIKNFIAEPPGAKEGDIVLLFYCTTAQDPQLLEPEKFSEWKWVELKEYLHNNLYSIMNPGAYKAACDYLTKHALNA